MLRKFLITILVLAGIGGAAYLSLQALKARHEASKHTEPVAVAAPAVTVTKVTAADFVETAIVSGSLIPREEILVSPEIEGFRVLELFADEGSRVTKGQVLARLVASQLEAQRAQNDANLARTIASIAQANAQITEAEARAKEAAAQLQRAEPLKRSGYLSGAVYDQRESAARTSQAQLAAAKDALRAAEAEKAQVEAQRRELDWKFGNTEVKSPADGIVSRRNARIGALATAAGEPMFRIIQNGEIELDAEVVETELPRVKVGQKATVTVPGTGQANGTVRLVATEVDKTTRLGKVRIFLGEKPQFRIGSFARGTIETARSHGLAVETASVTFDPAGAFVQRVTGDKIEKRIIKTGLVSGDRVEVIEGLNEGDIVVARAGTFLRDGDAVRPITPDAKVSEVK
jgi:HlyD family secretion protein